jgi:ketosteroid isomerase-like protein
MSFNIKYFLSKIFKKNVKYTFILGLCCSVIFASCDNTGTVPAAEQNTETTTFGGKQTQTPAQAEQEIRDRLDEWIKAIMQQDKAALNRLAADEHIYTGFDGSTFTKAANIESLTNPMFHIGTIETEDVKVQTHGDAAVITGRANLKMTAESGSSESATRFTQTWIRRNGVWQLAAEHTSQVPQDAKH